MESPYTYSRRRFLLLLLLAAAATTAAVTGSFNSGGASAETSPPEIASDPVASKLYQIRNDINTRGFSPEIFRGLEFRVNSYLENREVVVRFEGDSLSDLAKFFYDLAVHSYNSNMRKTPYEDLIDEIVEKIITLEEEALPDFDYSAREKMAEIARTHAQLLRNGNFADDVFYCQRAVEETFDYLNTHFGGVPVAGTNYPAARDFGYALRDAANRPDSGVEIYRGDLTKIPPGAILLSFDGPLTYSTDSDGVKWGDTAIITGTTAEGVNYINFAPGTIRYPTLQANINSGNIVIFVLAGADVPEEYEQYRIIIDGISELKVLQATIANLANTIGAEKTRRLIEGVRREDLERIESIPIPRITN